VLQSADGVASRALEFQCDPDKLPEIAWLLCNYLEDDRSFEKPVLCYNEVHIDVATNED
jgi:hypothetical protein